MAVFVCFGSFCHQKWSSTSSGMIMGQFSSVILLCFLCFCTFFRCWLFLGISCIFGVSVGFLGVLLGYKQGPAGTRYSNRTRNCLSYSNPTRFFVVEKLPSSFYSHCWIVAAMTTSLFVILPIGYPGILSNKKYMLFSKAKQSEYNHWQLNWNKCQFKSVKKLMWKRSDQNFYMV